MIIIEVKENEPIDRALKRYKRKYRNIKMLQEIRSRQYYEKPSVKRRNEFLKAVYREQKQKETEEA